MHFLNLPAVRFKGRIALTLSRTPQYEYQFKKWGLRMYMTKNCLHNPIAIGVRLSMARKENDGIAVKPQLIFHGRVFKDRTLRRKGS